MSNTQGVCPVCDAPVATAQNTEVSEVLPCPECGTSLVVESISADKVTLAQAPAIEEDWGQ